MTKWAKGRQFSFTLETLCSFLFLCPCSLICLFSNRVELLSKTLVMLSQLITTVRKKPAVFHFFCLVSKSQGSMHTSHTVTRGARVWRSFQKDTISPDHKGLLSLSLLPWPSHRKRCREIGERAFESRAVEGRLWGTQPPSLEVDTCSAANPTSLRC